MGVDYKALTVVGLKPAELPESVQKHMEDDEYYDESTEEYLELHGGNCYSEERGGIIGIDVGSDYYCQGATITLEEIEIATKRFKEIVGVEPKIYTILCVS
jgi:hypothetical protein